MHLLKPGLAATLLALGMIALVIEPADGRDKDSDATEKSLRNDEPAQRLDLFGDPLPDGVLARLGSYRWRDGHGGFATVAVAPDGKSLISGVRIWDIESGKQRAELKLNRKAQSS